nr:tyrosine-type recombinase/integrase [Sphingomonas koreensis]
MRAITKGLPRQPKKDGHFAAMPYAQVTAFVAKLRERESFSRLARGFAILTAARSGEVHGATWHDINAGARLWTIPKDRMKTHREQVVPLAKSAMQVIERCQELGVRDCPLVFPGLRGSQSLSDMTLTKLLKE